MAVLIAPVKPEDTKAIVAFYDEVHAVDPTVGAISESGWVRFLNQPFSYGGKEFLTARYNNQIVGLATSSRRITHGEAVRHFRILVTPQRRRQEIGTALLKDIVRLDAEASVVILQSLCPANWIAALAFYEHFGFRVVESELLMRCEQPSSVILSNANDVKIERAESPALHATEIARLHNLAYRDDISFVSYTSESMAELLSSEGIELWLLWYGDKIVAYCHLEVSDEVVWVESLVVDPAHQGKSFGGKLASTILDHTMRNPPRIAELQVSDQNPRALRLYQWLGFRQIDASRRLRADWAQVAERLGI